MTNNQKIEILNNIIADLKSAEESVRNGDLSQVEVNLLSIRILIGHFVKETQLAIETERNT